MPNTCRAIAACTTPQLRPMGLGCARHTRQRPRGDPDLLAHALDYFARGLTVVPIRSADRDKKPTRRYGRFVRERQTEDVVRQMFARARNANGLAFFAAASHGAASRDFDKPGSYRTWAQRHPDLAATLPTVRTKRGEHVLFRSDYVKDVPLGDGEFRGAGLSVLPPSLHHDGRTRYGWIIPLAGDLPFVPAETFGVVRKAEREPADVTEYTECHLSPRPAPAAGVSVLSVLSVSSVDDVIAATLPTKPGERNAKLLNLARGLKYDTATPAAELKDVVRRWHARALPVIATKSFTVTWADFLHAYERALHPLGANPVDAAAHRVDPYDLPDVAREYDGDALRIIGLCYELAKAGNGRFFLSCHDLASRCGTTPMRCWRLLRMLEYDGVLRCVDRGNQRRAARFVWTGGES